MSSRLVRARPAKFYWDILAQHGLDQNRLDSPGVIFGSTLLGLAIRSALPENHKSEDSRKVVILAMGLVATMTSLVLSLLLSSARST